MLIQASVARMEDGVEMSGKIITLIDVRRLPRAEREKLRTKAYEGYCSGKTAYLVSNELRVRATSVYRWYNNFKTSDTVCLEERKRGPETSATAILSQKKREKLASVVREKTPDQMGLDFSLWSSKAIQEYVRKTSGKMISRKTARRYMQNLGFSYRSPVRYAKEQNLQTVNQWLNETYPAIKREALRNQATIMWADETTNMIGDGTRRGYSPRGKAPVLKVPNKRKVRCNSISAISNRGEIDFMFFDGAMNTDIFKFFCEKLVRCIDRSVYLIVDNLRVHHAKLLKPWLEQMEHQTGFRIYYLPSYSPELNPDEYLNRSIKAHLAEKSIPVSEIKLKQAIKNYLINRKRSPQSIIKLFHKKEIQYAV